MKKIQVQGFDVDDDNLPNPGNLPEPTPVDFNAPPILNWNTHCIICPQRAANLQNSFASFFNYLRADVMKMSRLDMFLIMTPMQFSEDTLINNKNEQLDVPITTDEYIKWVGCWMYMLCWVDIHNRIDWWSTSAPSRHKGAHLLD